MKKKRKRLSKAQQVLILRQKELLRDKQLEASARRLGATRQDLLHIQKMKKQRTQERAEEAKRRYKQIAEERTITNNEKENK